jgi:hypothetical protein
MAGVIDEGFSKRGRRSTHTAVVGSKREVHGTASSRDVAVSQQTSERPRQYRIAWGLMSNEMLLNERESAEALRRGCGPTCSEASMNHLSSVTVTG